MSGVRTVYVEFGRDRPPMAWQDGRQLAEDDMTAFEDMHRELIRLVLAATVDLQSENLRAVRSGGALLVETRVDDGRARPRIDATIVIDRPVRVRWKAAAAQIAEALHEGGVATDRRSLQTALVGAWRLTSSVPERLTAPLLSLCARATRTRSPKVELEHR